MKKLLFQIFVFSVLSIGVQAQKVTGNVTENGLPLPGVNIVSDTGKNAVTDFDGNFQIEANNGENLTFSMIGYQTKKVTVSSTTLKVVMMEEVNKLNEVVVVGYGTRRFGAITGSVSVIKSEDILKTPAQSAIQSIQGKAAGVNIVTNDEPGGNPTIRIRGLGTILQARDPLYVIDGVEITTLNGTSPINGLSANDIESMNILKDASSLAIYGQKGANGVVLITTKKGKKGGVKVAYDGYYGQKNILKKVDMADSYRYAYYNNIAKGSSTYFNLNNQPYNTYWLDEITQTGEVINNAVSISSAGDNGNYYFGVSHYKEDGILIGSQYKRTNILNKSEFSLEGDWLKVRNFINLTLADKIAKPVSAFTNAYRQAPIMPVRYPNGRWGMPLINLDNGYNDLSGTHYQRYNNVANPVAQLENTNEKSKSATLSASVAIDLKLYKDLVLTSSYGATADWTKEFVYTPLREIWFAQNILDGTGNVTDNQDFNASFGNNPVLYNKLQQKRSDFYNWNWDNYLTYKKEIGKHNFTVVAGISRTTTNNFEFLNASAYNVPEQSSYWTLDFSNYNGKLPASDLVENKHNTIITSLAYFGRLEYEFNNKYLFSASIRREGISSFPENQRWGTFPSVSAGWIVSNENFMKGVTFIDNLKIRAGYGEVGNGNGPSLGTTSFAVNKNYSFNGVIYTGAYKDTQPDPNLTWETVKEIDLGLDFTILSSKLSGTIDYYNRKSDDVILQLSPPSVLSENSIFVNSGEITNKGIEATLRWQDKINDNLSYWIGGNFSYNKNTVSRIDSSFFQNFPLGGGLGNGQTVKRVFLNEPLGSFYVFDQIGYDSDGKPAFRDVNGDGIRTEADRINAGSYLPDYTYGINLGLTYRNIDFSVDLYGVGGNKVYNGKKAQRYDGENVENDLLDNFWSPSNPNAENPKPFNEVPVPSTYYVEDGSYLRINNITLGYTLPKMFDKLDKVRFYVTAVNPIIFTDYSGFSPEVSGSDKGDPLRSAGIEIDAYPTNKTFLLGANVNF